MVQVTFTMPSEAGALAASVVGDFTEWQPLDMKPDGAGGHEVVLDLPSGTSYRFRYLLDGERWENDWDADAYVANDFGGDDSVLDLSSEEPAVPTAARKPARRAAPRKPVAKKAKAARASDEK